MISNGKFGTLLGLAVIAVPLYASNLSPEAVEGKAVYPSCHVCHNQALEPPLGPPMWGVQRRYKRSTLDREDFVTQMVNFVKAPSLENAIHDKAVAEMGLMPPLPLPDDMLKKIATYIYEENFAPPCDHWKTAVKKAQNKGDVEHAKKDQMMLNRFCAPAK